MSGGFIKFSESDLGSKGRAKQATIDFPKVITAEAKWRVRAVWFRVLETARALCLGYGVFLSGTLYRTIRIEERGVVSGDVNEMIQGIPQEQGDKIISSEIVAGGMLINPNTGRICDYAKFVHDGHFTRSGSWVPPRPFLRDAIYFHLNEILEAFGEAIDSAINTIWVGD